MNDTLLTQATKSQELHHPKLDSETQPKTGFFALARGLWNLISILLIKNISSRSKGANIIGKPYSVELFIRRGLVNKPLKVHTS